MTDLFQVFQPTLGLLMRSGIVPVIKGQGLNMTYWVPEWAAIVGRAMLAAIMLTSEGEVVDLITRVANDPELQSSVVGSTRVGIRPMDLYLLLKGMNDE